jgi:mevalonate kinase
MNAAIVSSPRRPSSWGSRRRRSVVRVRSEIPAGRGLGSSAALSVAVLRATAAAAGRSLDVATTLAQGRALERIFHGTPSGVDPAAAALGTCIRFVRGEPPAVTPVRVGRTRPHRDRLGRRRAQHRRRRSADCASGGKPTARRTSGISTTSRASVEDGVAAVERGDVEALGAAFDRNQALLATLGVSSPAIETRVAAARAAGALGAKLTGGGAGGAIIAVARDADALAAAMRRTDATVLVVDVTATEAVARSA